MSARTWMAHAGAVAGIVGGVLGVYLLTQGPNAYGSYAGGWDGALAPLTAALLAAGVGSAYAVADDPGTEVSWGGVRLALAGCVAMGLGYAVDDLWFLIFLGSLVLVPLGFIWLGVRLYRQPTRALWWRMVPLVVGVLAVLGLGIELWEEMRGDRAGDWGVALVQATLSLAGMVLGLGRWLNLGGRRRDAGRAA